MKQNASAVFSHEKPGTYLKNSRSRPRASLVSGTSHLIFNSGCSASVSRSAVARKASYGRTSAKERDELILRRLATQLLGVRCIFELGSTRGIMGAVSRKSNRTINNGRRVVYQRCAMSAKSSYGLDRKLEPERISIPQSSRQFEKGTCGHFGYLHPP